MAATSSSEASCPIVQFDQSYIAYKQSVKSYLESDIKDVHEAYERSTAAYRQFKQEGRSLLKRTSDFSPKEIRVISKFLSGVKKKRHSQKKRAHQLFSILTSPSFITHSQKQCAKLIEIYREKIQAHENIYQNIQQKYAWLEAKEKIKPDMKGQILDQQLDFFKYRRLFLTSMKYQVCQLQSIHHELSLGTSGSFDTQEKANHAIEAIRVDMHSLQIESKEFLGAHAQFLNQIKIS